MKLQEAPDNNTTWLQNNIRFKETKGKEDLDNKWIGKTIETDAYIAKGKNYGKASEE
jgi:hypothetical protein